MMPATALPTQDQADVKMMATLAMPPLEQNKAADSFGQRTSNPLLSTASRGIYEAHMWENSCQREARATRSANFTCGYAKEKNAARSYDLTALCDANQALVLHGSYYEKGARAYDLAPLNC